MIDSVDILYANKLRHLRMSKSIKQEILAKDLNMSQQAFSNLENGKTNFTDELIEKISELFKISAVDFVKPNEQVNISNSPNTNSNSSQINDNTVIDALVSQNAIAVKAQLETITLQKVLIENLQKHIKLLEKK